MSGEDIFVVVAKAAKPEQAVRNLSIGQLLMLSDYLFNDEQVNHNEGWPRVVGSIVTNEQARRHVDFARRHAKGVVINP